jgi:transcriptional regulator with XRE-family HTH domain
MTNTFPNCIEELRIARGFKTRLPFADEVGISEGQMSRIERGLCMPREKVALRICKVLGRDVEYIWGKPSKRKSSSGIDSMLLDSIFSWLLKACSKHKIKMPPAKLTKFATFIYDEVQAEKLNFQETKYITFILVKALKLVER